jgi:glycosyltransferase involved in cell wall biosynthesis
LSGGREPAAGPGLTVRMDTRLPSSLPVGRGTAIFCSGACFHGSEAIRALELVVDGKPHRPAAWRMPRLDLFELSNGDGRWYRSGFWAVVPIDAHDRPGRAELSMRARLAEGRELIAPIGQIEIVEPGRPASHGHIPGRGDQGLIAICMATFNPDTRLFRRQIDSLRAQTDEHWICLISDDCSSPERFADITAAVADDPRFVVSRSPQNLGPYRNFERALEMVPAGADLVTLCDQDDRWYPEKLRVLRDALGSAQLVYSDQRLVDAEDRVLRDTLWSERRNNHTNLASLLIANSVTGAATLFRRELAELARPFPDPPGLQFHDHWIALVALATGQIAYVDRPLYDYVQHEHAVFGQAGEHRSSARRRSLRRGRAAYFYGYLARAVLAQALVARCSGLLTARKRRTLERFLAGANRPLAFAWLATRPLRGLIGANETLGTEAELAGGIVWRHLVRALVARRRVPGRLPVEAACPPLELETLGQSRLARWRTRMSAPLT